MAKPKVYQYTDPDGDTLDMNLNRSFGDLQLTIFCGDPADNTTAGVRMTMVEWRRLVSVVNEAISKLPNAGDA